MNSNHFLFCAGTKNGTQSNAVASKFANARILIVNLFDANLNEMAKGAV